MNVLQMTGTIQRVAVQDRQRLVREGLSLLLDAEPDVEVCVRAATAEELLVQTEGERLDVVLLEFDGVEWDPSRLVAALRERHPGVVVIATTTGDGPVPVRAYQAGIRMVISRRTGVRNLLQAVRSVRQASSADGGSNVICLDERRSNVLSRREVEVLDAIGTGATARHVAMQMGISAKTVENYKQRIFTKLGVQNQAHAVAVAVRHGLIDPSGSALPTSA
jgi:two-component system invasion response regulator UvrY